MQTVRLSNKNKDYKELSLYREFLESIDNFNLDAMAELCNVMKVLTIDNNYHFTNNANTLVFKVFKSLTFHDIKIILKRLKINVD